MSDLHPEVRALAERVLEALAIPHAATVGHGETEDRIVLERVRCLVVALEHLTGTRHPDLDWSLGYLRERLAEYPATGYVTHEQARERVADGATWAEAVSLDYRGPGGKDGAA